MTPSKYTYNSDERVFCHFLKKESVNEKYEILNINDRIADDSRVNISEENARLSITEFKMLGIINPPLNFEK